MPTLTEWEAAHLRKRLDTLTIHTVEEARALKAKALTLPFCVVRRPQLQAFFDCLSNFSAIPEMAVIVRVRDGLEIWRIGGLDSNPKDQGERCKGRKGEDSCKAKLSERAVKVIRARYEAGETLESLADAFNVTTCNIHSIVSRKSWAHI